MQIWTRQSFLISLCIVLSSCGVTQEDDLDQFMKQSANDMRVKIEPLPEVQPYVPVQYNADGTLNDPFKPRKVQAGKTSGLQPNMNRPREALEAFPLENLKYVGLISKAKLKYALIQAPDGTVQQAKIGNYVGQNFGIITDITDASVKLKEIVQDDLSGEWTERSASIDLQE